jgi:hypothetical protein
MSDNRETFPNKGECLRMSNTVAVNMWLTREFKPTKDGIDSRESPVEESVDTDFTTSPFYPALVMARFDHTCWKSTREAIKACLER